MKKIAVFILYSLLKTSLFSAAAMPPRITDNLVHTRDQRTATLSFEGLSRKFHFTIKVGQTDTELTACFLHFTKQVSVRPALTFVNNGPDLPTIITREFLETHYPDNKNFEICTIFSYPYPPLSAIFPGTSNH